CFFFFSSRRRHTRFKCDWSSDVCSSDLRCLFSAWADWLGFLSHARGARRSARRRQLAAGGRSDAWDRESARYVAQRDRHSRCRRSEEHTSELQSHLNLVCRLLLEKKK